MDKITKIELKIEKLKRQIQFKKDVGHITKNDEVKLQVLEFEQLELIKYAGEQAKIAYDIQQEQKKISKYADYLDMKGTQVVNVKEWAKLSLALANDFKLVKVGEIILKKDTMQVVKQSELLGMVSRALGNSSSHIDSLVFKKMESYIKSEDIKTDEKHIVVKNGRFNIRKKTFEKGDFKSINKINVDYNPDAKSKLGREILDRYVGDNEGFDTQFFEAVGLGMWQARSKQAIFCNGDSNFGKSWLFENMVQPVIGSYNFTTFALGDMTRETNSSLINKTLAYDSDSSTGVIKGPTIENFKKVTGDGTVTAKILYKNEFNFENYATAWINCNGLPVWSDIGSGGSLENRMNVMQFTVNVKEKFPDPTEQVKTNQKEINEWVLKEALHALHDYVDRGKEFTKTQKSIEAMLQAYKHGDTVYRFLEAYLTEDIRNRKTGIPITNLFIAYEKTFLHSNEEESGYNYGDSKLGKRLFWKSVRDKQTEFGYEVFHSGGSEKIRFNKRTENKLKELKTKLEATENLLATHYQSEEEMMEAMAQYQDTLEERNNAS